MQHLPKNYRESKRGGASFPPIGRLWVGFGKCCIHAISNSSLKEYKKGKKAKQIFIDADIDLDVVGPKNAICNLHEWRKNTNSLKYKKCRNLKDALDKITYLEAENEFLKILHKNFLFLPYKSFFDCWQ